MDKSFNSFVKLGEKNLHFDSHSKSLKPNSVEHVQLHVSNFLQISKPLSFACALAYSTPNMYGLLNCLFPLYTIIMCALFPQLLSYSVPLLHGVSLQAWLS